jgi:AcrR family transcriptional regulator
MSTLTRKQREIQQRETLFLDVAQDLLLKYGYLGFSMDRVAAATEYSKGTIYQHFSCKEDLIAGVLIRTMRVREQLFAKAATFRGLSRERMTAIGVADQVFAHRFPDHDRIERITKVESIWEKASTQRRDQFMARDTNCLGTVHGIIRDGIARNELDLPDGLTEEGLLFGLWSMAVGGRIIITHGILGGIEGFEELEILQDRNYQVYLDSYRWRPFSTEHDYPAVVARVQEEVFADELEAIRG